jgi:hypothetical protein
MSQRSFAAMAILFRRLRRSFPRLRLTCRAGRGWDARKAFVPDAMRPEFIDRPHVKFIGYDILGVTARFGCGSKQWTDQIAGESYPIGVIDPEQFALPPLTRYLFALMMPSRGRRRSLLTILPGRTGRRAQPDLRDDQSRTIAQPDRLRRGPGITIGWASERHCPTRDSSRAFFHGLLMPPLGRADPWQYGQRVNTVGSSNDGL